MHYFIVFPPLHLSGGTEVNTKHLSAVVKFYPRGDLYVAVLFPSWEWVINATPRPHYTRE